MLNNKNSLAHNRNERVCIIVSFIIKLSMHLWLCMYGSIILVDLSLSLSLISLSTCTKPSEDTRRRSTRDTFIANEQALSTYVHICRIQSFSQPNNIHSTRYIRNTREISLRIVRPRALAPKVIRTCVCSRARYHCNE